MIDPKIETLLMVYETGSFTQAAERLSLTQPAVSQHVSQIERELNVKVFNRAQGGLKLTIEGEIVIKYAKRIKALYENLGQSLKDAKTHVTRMTVGLTHTAENNIMSEVFARLCNENEGMKLTIISDTIKNLYNKLKTYEIDLAIIEGKIPQGSFNSILLDTDSLMLVVSMANPLAQKTVVTLNDLKKEKMILRGPMSGTRQLFESHLKSNNFTIDDFNVILEVDNVSTIKELVQHNLGISILSKSSCISEVKKGKFKMLPIENLSMIREINMVYHRDFSHTELLDEITKIYSNCIQTRAS